MSRWLSIDPGGAKPHAVAFWDGDRLARVALVPAADLPGLAGAELVVIEDQYAGRNGGTVIGLAKSAGHAIGSLGMALNEARWASPAVWKSAICKPHGCSTHKPKTRVAYEREGYGVYDALLSCLPGGSLAALNDALTLCRGYSKRLDLIDAVAIGYWHIQNPRTAP